MLRCKKTDFAAVYQWYNERVHVYSAEPGFVFQCQALGLH